MELDIWLTLDRVILVIRLREEDTGTQSAYNVSGKGFRFVTAAAGKLVQFFTDLVSGIGGEVVMTWRRHANRETAVLRFLVKSSEGSLYLFIVFAVLFPVESEVCKFRDFARLRQKFVFLKRFGESVVAIVVVDDVDVNVLHRAFCCCGRGWGEERA